MLAGCCKAARLVELHVALSRRALRTPRPFHLRTSRLGRRHDDTRDARRCPFVEPLPFSHLNVHLPTVGGVSFNLLRTTALSRLQNGPELTFSFILPTVPPPRQRYKAS